MFETFRSCRAGSLSGVQSVNVNLTTEQGTVFFDSESVGVRDIINAINDVSDFSR